MRLGQQLLAAGYGAWVLIPLLGGCVGSKPEEPSGHPLADATPVRLPPSRSGNAPRYQVRGNTYQVLRTSKGYRETGMASWYGPGFHGKLTASGERYDSNAMSAAHKSLPLPSFVRVTRLDNGKSIVVKVNDRGPFVKGRIIDLSYAAAKKLGMLKQGVVRVRIESLAPHQHLGGANAFGDSRLAYQTTPLPSFN